MSSGEHGAMRVESCIYRRQNGRYAVRVRLGDTTTGRRTFNTLTEARNYRNEAKKDRPKPERHRDERVTGKANFHRTGYIPDDTVLHKNRLRNFIAKAPRRIIERDGRNYTLIELPDLEVTT